MERIMGDSTELADIPRDVDVVGTYINGDYAVSRPTLEMRFPHHRYGHCWIDVNGSRPDADVRDWENGDFGGDLEKWVKDHNAHNGRKDAVIYGSQSVIPDIRKKTKSQILGVDYFLFVAMLDGQMYAGDGVVACQRDGEQQTGGHWDRSFIFKEDLWAAVPLIGRPNCTLFERAIRAPVNNHWGNVVDQHLAAIRAVSDRPRQWPFGVEFAQKVVGTIQDGNWGPNSEAALKDTVASAQEALLLMGYDPKGIDGIWGPNTNNACKEARIACFH